MSQQRLIDAAKEAIMKVFGDTSVSQAETAEALCELRDEIDLLLETLDD